MMIVDTEDAFPECQRDFFSGWLGFAVKRMATGDHDSDDDYHNPDPWR